ncbi:response regulator [Flavobacterium sp. HBTb2-11-1]|uniref:response regulator n=1 Tax=Flavobacterium sp. HBTb2-11-1 TaxID=2692212 RepID=UPI00136A5A37|nr:response regulator [Flavobacterium sp. HBTb2-11-1]MXO04862.1 response regulator [Flavobacterium sp. HBTb2-11-1]
MKTRIILLIDDDCDDIAFFKEAFAEMGDRFRLICADGGAKAIQMLYEMDSTPALIFLDAGMPMINGWECLKLLKADSRFASCPIIMASTAALPSGIEKARDLGASAYMIKPWDFKELVFMVQLICAGLDGAIQKNLLELEQAMPKHFFVF